MHAARVAVLLHDAHEHFGVDAQVSETVVERFLVGVVESRHPLPDEAWFRGWFEFCG